MKETSLFSGVSCGQTEEQRAGPEVLISFQARYYVSLLLMLRVDEETVGPPRALEQGWDLG